MTTNLILDKINKNKKLIEVQTSRFKSFKKNLKSIKKTRRRIANANIYLIIKYNNKINTFKM